MPPTLPPLEDLIANPVSNTKSQAKKRNTVSKITSPTSSKPAPAMPGMTNLFEDASKSLFDEDDDEEFELEEEPEPPKPLGPIVINGQPAQLLAKTALDATRTQYKVILDSTGELKTYVSPPAQVAEGLSGQTTRPQDS